MRTFLLMIALIMATVGRIATIDTGPPPEEDKVYQESSTYLDEALVSSDEHYQVKADAGPFVLYNRDLSLQMANLIQSNSKRPTVNSQPVKAHIMPTVIRQPINLIQAKSQQLKTNSQSPVRAHVMPTVYRQLIYEAHPRTDKKIDPGSCSVASREIDKKDFLV